MEDELYDRFLDYRAFTQRDVRLFSQRQLADYGAEDSLYLNLLHKGQQQITSLKPDLEAIGLSPNILFDLAEYVDPDAQVPDAQVILDPYELRVGNEVYYVLLDYRFVEELRACFYRFFETPAVQSSFDRAKRVTGQLSFTDDLTTLAFEFSLYHEFSHVAYGHLAAMMDQYKCLNLHACGVQEIEDSAMATTMKVFELDADLMALIHLCIRLKNEQKMTLAGPGATVALRNIFHRVGFALTVLFRSIEGWRRIKNPVYLSNFDHPHPDVRDGVIYAYLHTNHESFLGWNEPAIMEGYKQGRELAIEAIAEAPEMIPNFEVATELGQGTAIKEVGMLMKKLNAMRKTGCHEKDTRRRISPNR